MQDHTRKTDRQCEISDRMLSSILHNHKLTEKVVDAMVIPCEPVNAA